LIPLFNPEVNESTVFIINPYPRFGRQSTLAKLNSHRGINKVCAPFIFNCYIKSVCIIEVAPLDSFRVVIKAKIHNITIKDATGKVVYTGSIPKTTNYTYAVVDIRELEDPLFPPMTDGKYHRSIRACQYPFPELIERPLIALDGDGESDRRYITGFYGEDILYNSTHIWSGDSYITNITLGQVPVSPIYFFNGNIVDLGFYHDSKRI